MAGVHLPSFEIAGFRGFEHLELEKLGMVNLITGKNNVGKTTLLEALRIYAQRGSFDSVLRMLALRDEGEWPRRSAPEYRKLENLLRALRYLFFGRRDIGQGRHSLALGPIDDPQRMLEISILQASPNSTIAAESHPPLLDGDEFIVRKQDLIFIVRYESEAAAVSLRGASSNLFAYDILTTEVLPNYQVSANGLSRAQIARLWDATALTDWEASVVESLKILSPDVERVSMVSSRSGDGENPRVDDRIPIIKLRSEPTPVPLKSLGEGMNRLFGLVLALVNAQSGLLLIDEIESGLHYSVQLDVWRLVFSVARSLNVQVFATTHSWDCIQAFQQAACEDVSDGMLIRLERRDDRIISTLFDERRLAIATREQIEVR